MRFLSLFLVISAFVVQTTAQATDTLLNSIFSDVSSIYSSITSDFESTLTPSTIEVGATGDPSVTQTPSPIFITVSYEVSSATVDGTLSVTLVSFPTTTTQSTSPSASRSTTSSSLSSSITSRSAISSATAKSSIPPTTAAAVNNGLSHGRIVSIIVGVVLGALALGLVILLGIILFCRRRHSRQGSILKPDDETPTSGPGRGGLQAWFGSGRHDQREHTTTTQPLMSEVPSQHGLRSSAPNQSSRPMPGATATSGRWSDSGTPSHLDERYRQDVEPEICDQVTSAQPRGMTDTGIEYQEPELDYRSTLLHQEVGKPYNQTVPQTPDILRSTAGRHKRSGSVFPDDFPAPQFDPLAAHPASAADLAAVSSFGPERAHFPVSPVTHPETGVQSQVQNDDNFLDLSSEQDEEESSNAPSSISRQGFANAIAGVGLQSGDENHPNPGGVGQIPQILSGGQNLEPTQSSSTTAQPDLSETRQELVPNRTSGPTKPATPRLDIPSILIAGRKRSKRARFNLDGDISPPTGSWLLDRDDQKRSSTISPISPEQHTSRRPSYSPLQEGYHRLADDVDAANDPSARVTTHHGQAAPAILVSPAISDISDGKRDIGSTPSGGIRRQTLPQHQLQHGRTPEVQSQTRNTISHPPTLSHSRAVSDRNLDIGSPNRVVRKPVSFRPPTSRYAQSQIMPSQSYQVLRSPTRFPSIHGRGAEYEYKSLVEASTPLIPPQTPSKNAKGKEKAQSSTEMSQELSRSHASHSDSGATSKYGQQKQKEKEQIDSLRWWNEEANREYAKMYGGYYASTKRATTHVVSSSQQSNPASKSQEYVRMKPSSYHGGTALSSSIPHTISPPTQPTQTHASLPQSSSPQTIANFGSLKPYSSSHPHILWRDSQRDSWLNSASGGSQASSNQ